MMNAGKMRHRIAFQHFTGVRDELGDPLTGEEENWEPVAEVWAAIDPISGREFYAAEQSQTEITHKIRCRYQPGLTPALRIAFGTRYFRIVSILDWEERHESLLIMAKEMVDRGTHGS